jgi:hypothetical protein
MKSKIAGTKEYYTPRQVVMISDFELKKHVIALAI